MGLAEYHVTTVETSGVVATGNLQRIHTALFSLNSKSQEIKPSRTICLWSWKEGNRSVGTLRWQCWCTKCEPRRVEVTSSGWHLLDPAVRNMLNAGLDVSCRRWCYRPRKRSITTASIALIGGRLLRQTSTWRGCWFSQLGQGLWTPSNEAWMGVHVCVGTSSNFGKAVLETKERGMMRLFELMKVKRCHCPTNVPNWDSSGMNWTSLFGNTLEEQKPWKSPHRKS